MARGGVFGERDVVLGCLADAGPVRLEREAPAVDPGYHLHLRSHATKRRCEDGPAPGGASMATLIRERYELVETLGAGGRRG